MIYGVRRVDESQVVAQEIINYMKSDLWGKAQGRGACSGVGNDQLNGK